MLTFPAQETQLNKGARLLSYSRAIAPVDLLAFLRSAPPHEQRIYWENRDDEIAFAGYGAALELTAAGHDRIASIQRQARDVFDAAIVEGLETGIVPRLFGGFAFRPDHQPQGPWSAFPSAYFVLPRYLLTRSGDRAWLTVNAFIEPGAENALSMTLASMIQRLAALNQTRWLSEYDQTWMRSPEISFPLGHDFWVQQVETAVGRIRAGELGKVVLSRTMDIAFSDPIDPLFALENLRQRYKDTFRFLIEPAVDNAFFGATPELLVNVSGARLETAALAGSRPRGSTPESDHELALDLLLDPKERSEHAFVADAVRELLAPMVTGLHAPGEPGILKLSNIQHLHTPFEGTLKPGADILSIVERLHPTPALGGYPQRVATDVIARTEPIDRGWYAAPIGWFDHEGNGTFAVAIRSAVTVDCTARLYAGAGIVADSQAEREWDETRLKFRPVANALGVALE
jgi:menaquinone-specific isochorismate synthase